MSHPQQQQPYTDLGRGPPPSQPPSSPGPAQRPSSILQPPVAPGHARRGSTGTASIVSTADSLAESYATTGTGGATPVPQQREQQQQRGIAFSQSGQGQGLKGKERPMFLSDQPTTTTRERERESYRSLSSSRARAPSQSKSRPGLGARVRSRSRVPLDEEEEEVGEEGQEEEGDDEVERRDRGEELVRKRVRARREAKKEADRRAKQLAPLLPSSSFGAAPAVARTPRSPFIPSSTYGEDDPVPLFPSASTAASAARARSREPSSAAIPQLQRRDLSGTSTLGGGGGHEQEPSGASTIHGGSSYSYGAGSEPGSPSLPAAALPVGAGPGPGRSILLPSSASSAAGGEDPFADRYAPAATATATARPESVISDEAWERAHGDEPGSEDGAERGEGLLDELEEEEGEEEEGEYTLKDRQDAINIEHPFGLPIWKPALYKKSRSVQARAESALHAPPSLTSVRLWAIDNLLWSLFLGLPLFLVFAVVAVALWLVPGQGRYYGRVLWDLGRYLAWPFGGHYVEGRRTEARGHLYGYDVQVDDDDDHATEEEEGRTPTVESSSEEEARGHERTLKRERTITATSSSSSSSSSSSAAGGGTMTGEESDDDDAGSVVQRAWAGEGQEGEGELPDEPVRRRTITPKRPAPLVQQHQEGATERTALLRGGGRQNGGVKMEGREERGEEEHQHREGSKHTLGRFAFKFVFYLVVGPLMLLACLLCWALVFPVPMAKLLWVLVRHLNEEPLTLHFRAPSALMHQGHGQDEEEGAGEQEEEEEEEGVRIRAGQPAPRLSKKAAAASRRHGRIVGNHPTVLLCVYRAAGLQYYKYTVGGVNILFINLLSLVFFVIFDEFFVVPRVEDGRLGGPLFEALADKAFVFTLALLSVIPLSYFIGMAVASISAQSSIGMGAVINASFGSVIEIILYAIALTNGKSELVEGSIVGSILAGVLLMPGMSMIGGALRRKEQRFNAKSAGVTSTMLIMAIIGILTPTVFYEIYGSFQLICSGCDLTLPDTDMSVCKTCYWEHINPAADPFYETTVKKLSIYCAVLLVLSYLIGLWFSLRTHASHIWQNAAPAPPHDVVRLPAPATAAGSAQAENRTSLYKRVIPQQVLQILPSRSASQARPASSLSHNAPPVTPTAASFGQQQEAPPSGTKSLRFPNGMTAEDLMEVVAGAIKSVPAHAREVSKGGGDGDTGEHGGHDAPNWSRMRSATVLMSCTVLYAIIAEILVDLVDVVLDGSGIPEKFLGVSLFALVPNTTEFMNAISFAINGNISLSMEIGSAYALQVCLLQIPVMLAFSIIWSRGKTVLAHHIFTLVFPRWDVIAIIFSVFLLTYTYIEARANYYRGSILALAYLVLIGGFYFEPRGRDTEDNPLLWLASTPARALFWATSGAEVPGL